MKRVGYTVVLGMTFIILGSFLLSCGRTPSRYFGKGQRQVIEVKNMKRFISVSFSTRGSSTVKDVTFEATDGYVYTQEFKDISPLEGTIRWVKHDESSSLIQSRSLSRWFGSVVNLKLPKDCQEVLGVDVTPVGKKERVKNLTYRSTGGKILSREYREGFISRNFGGWLEIKAQAKK